MTQVPQFLVGLDLGQAQDPTALVVLERVTPTRVVHREREVDGYRLAVPVREAKPVEYYARHLVRLPLGTSYQAVVRRVGELLVSPKLASGPAYDEYRTIHAGMNGFAAGKPIRVPRDRGPALVVDGSGVGRAVVDMFRAAGLKPIPISIHSGRQWNFEQGYWNVPKRDLAGVVRVLLDTRRLKIVPTLPLAAALAQELEAFRVNISPLTGHDSYGAATDWRAGGAHDDLVLALACAAWYAEHMDRNKRDFNPDNWGRVYP